MNIELSEKQLIYILNSINITLRFMTYHYQITDIKEEVKHYFNFDNYNFDYNNLIDLHRILSLSGNKQFYNIINEVFFKGQKDYLCTKEKDFEILKKLERYENLNNKNQNFIKLNSCRFKIKFNFFNRNIDKIKKIV